MFAQVLKRGTAAGAMKAWANRDSNNLPDAAKRIGDGKTTEVPKEKVAALLRSMSGGKDHHDITNLTVDGVHVFGKDGLNIPRKDMPQIPRSMRAKFIEDHKASLEDVDPVELKPVQHEIDGNKVGGMLKKMDAGTFEIAPIIVSKDSYIIDGHHTWATYMAQRLTDPKVKLPVHRFEIGHKELLAEAQKFTDDNDIKRKDITKMDWVSILKGTSAGATLAWKKRNSNALPDTKAITFGGKDKGWTMADGKPLSAEVKAALARQKGAIPPAWTEVKVNVNPDAKCIVIGFDAKGREQRRYSTEHSGEAAAAKFARISELQKHIPKLLKQSTADMLDDDLSDRLRDDAATVNLVLKTGFRPGSTADTGAEEQAFGASTLEKRHIKLLQDSTIHFTFTGKKGVTQDKYLKDKDLHAYLSEKLSELSAHDQVFKSSSQSAGKYLKGIAGEQFKVKDLRTWNGTALARNLLKKEPAPENQKDFKALQNKIGDAVSAHLGNTRSVAIASYIDPAVWPPISSEFAPIKKAA